MEIQKRHGIAIAFLAAILFGAAAPIGKPLLVFLNDFQLAGLLYLGAAGGVISILIKEKKLTAPWRMRRSDALKMSGSVLFGGILGPVFLLAGLRIAAAGSVSLWLNMELVATAVLGFLFFKDHLSGKGWLASLGVLTAAILLAWEGGTAGFKAGGLITLACLCWGLDNHLTALIDGVSPAQITFWKGLIAGSVNLSLGVMMGAYSANIPQTLSALALGAIAYGLSILLYITSTRYLGATRAQLIFSSAPFFGLVIALVFGESLTLYQGIAFLLFLGSVFLLLKESHTHTHIHQPISHTHIHYHPDVHHLHEHPENEIETDRHDHLHDHDALAHDHPHWPDLHHRHGHDDRSSSGDSE